MPPGRRSLRASQKQKESEERLSIAEAIAGLANSFTASTVSPDDVVTCVNSCNDNAIADFARLPSMVIEELGDSAALPSSLYLPVCSASVDSVIYHRLRSRAGHLPVSVQSEPSVCSASVVVTQNQSTNIFSAPLLHTSDILPGHQHSDVAGSLDNDAVYSAVLMGWNPPVLATCPSEAVQSASCVTHADVSSPLSTLRTVDLAGSVGVLKLPLVLEPVSDGTWQVVPASASVAFGAGLLSNAECFIEAVARQGGVNGRQSAQDVGNCSSASSELVAAVDCSPLQLHSFGSLGVLGNYYSGSTSCSPSLLSTSERKHETSSVVNNVSCSNITCHSLIPSTQNMSDALSSVCGTTASSVLGSLAALRAYYKHSNVNNVPPSSGVHVFNSASSAADNSKLIGTFVSVCKEQIGQPLSCSKPTTVNSEKIQTRLNVVPQSVLSLAGGEANDCLPLRTSEVLASVSVDDHQTSSISVNKQLNTEYHCSSDSSKYVNAHLCHTESVQSPQQRSSKLLQHLPPKKRQKISGVVEYEHNCSVYLTRSELDTQEKFANSDNNVPVDRPIVTTNEEIVTHVELPLSSCAAHSGNMLLQLCCHLSAVK